MSAQKIGRALVAGFVAALLGVSIGAGAATAANSRQKAAAVAGRYHHAAAGRRLYGSAAPRGTYHASHAWSLPAQQYTLPPTQDPRDAWGGYFSNEVANPYYYGSNLH